MANLGKISSREIAREHERSKKRPKAVTIEEGADHTGFSVEHHTDDYPRPKHFFKKGSEMIKHVKEHMCSGESEKEEKEEKE